MSDPPDWKTIDRYLAGEASLDDRYAVDAWANAQPDRQVALAWLKSQSGAEPAWNANAAWHQFATRQRSYAVTRALSPRLWRLAAGLIIATGLGAGLVLAHHRDANAPAMREVFTLNGQRKSVTLVDGTRVSLNGGSRLRYDDDFGTKHRDVYLDGEGYFDVKHDAAKPFRVHVRDAVVKDVGTRFTVSAYTEQATVDVAVSEGAVAMGRDSANVRIAAGEIGILAPSGVVSVARVVSLDRYVGWTSGVLVLEGTTLGKAATQLEHWYGVKIVVADSSLSARPVSARFQGESVARALDALALALGAHVTRDSAGFLLSSVRR
jgi:transmembrane sensor